MNVIQVMDTYDLITAFGLGAAVGVLMTLIVMSRIK